MDTFLVPIAIGTRNCIQGYPDNYIGYAYLFNTYYIYIAHGLNCVSCLGGYLPKHTDFTFFSEGWRRNGKPDTVDELERH
jgi:hypothetical protein